MADGTMFHSESTFFAFKPGPETCETILDSARRLARDHGMRGRLFDAGTLHITLCEMGRPDRQRAPLEKAMGAAGDLVRSLSVDVVLDRAIGFNTAVRGYPNVLLASAQSTVAIANLHQAIVQSQLHQGLCVGRTGFRPHLTLSRASACWLFDSAIQPISWIADEFLLIHSYHDGQRRRHDVLGRWPLASGC